MFNRKDAAKLSGLKPNQIDYLLRIGIVSAVKVSHKKLLFSWGDVLEMKCISKLREKVSLQQIKDAKKYLEKINFSDVSLRNKKIVCITNKLVLIDKDKDISYILSGKSKGQCLLTVVFCDEIIDDIEQFGQNNIVNFENKKDDNYIPKMQYLLTA
jgi:hypothetical protein